MKLAKLFNLYRNLCALFGGYLLVSLAYLLIKAGPDKTTKLIKEAAGTGKRYQI